MSAEQMAGPKVLALFDELKLTRNEGWLTILHLCASLAVESGMTLAETQERIAKAYAVYEKAYAKRDAVGQS
jgi:hypothetical protein